MVRNSLLIPLILMTYKALGQTSPLTRLNHLMIVVDSNTYQVLSDPDFMTSMFAYTTEKEFDEWKGIYLIGEDNYLEFFHPTSVVGEQMDVGFNWACLSSMRSGYLDSVPQDTTSTECERDDYFTYLSYKLNDSTTAFSIYEMKRKQYETWVQKEFTDGMSFEPVDYNSRAESDSSKNYLFKNVVSVNYTIPTSNAPHATNFFLNCGFSIVNEQSNRIEFSNGEERISLFSDENVTTVILNNIELELNAHMFYESFTLGTTQLVVQGNRALWKLR
jgi:hypothetical protein